jgi:hypothetical protein
MAGICPALFSTVLFERLLTMAIPEDGWMMELIRKKRTGLPKHNVLFRFRSSLEPTQSTSKVFFA